MHDPLHPTAIQLRHVVHRHHGNNHQLFPSVDINSFSTLVSHPTRNKLSPSQNRDRESERGKQPAPDPRHSLFAHLTRKRAPILVSPRQRQIVRSDQIQRSQRPVRCPDRHRRPAGGPVAGQATLRQRGQGAQRRLAVERQERAHQILTLLISRPQSTCLVPPNTPENLSFFSLVKLHVNCVDYQLKISISVLN